MAHAHPPQFRSTEFVNGNQFQHGNTGADV